ncbi:hypothetical protein [Streptomyces olivaceoviridis]
MRTVRRTLASVAIGIGLLMGALAAPAAATSPAQLDCYVADDYNQFVANTPWHVEPYGSSRVAASGGGTFYIIQYCQNDYGNWWFQRADHLWAYEKYVGV